MRIRFECGVLDSDTRRWTSKAGTSTELTQLETDLLAYLAKHPDRPVSRDELLREVWGYAPGVTSRAPDHAVRRLRKKIEPDPSSPQVVDSVYGAGYRALGVVVEPETLQPELPAPAILVGRDTSLSTVDRLLATPGLVTLRGPGGVGKTALARQTLSSRRGWFVPLADASSHVELLTSTALALGLPLSDGCAAQSISRVGASLEARGPALLVLDNLEQLDAAPVIQSWLEAAPELRVLATSRRPIGLPDETVHLVRPLSSEHGVALLTARAGRRLDGAPDSILEQLVQALDGLPLAIELAAARLGMVPIEEMVQRLEHSLDVVKAQRPEDRPLRHRGLLASLEWSWSLLASKEQAALAALTVCPGGFDLPVAEAVLDAPDAMPTLDGLVLASMVSQDVDGRLRLYEAVRTFARTRMSSETFHAAEQRRRQYLLSRLPADRRWLLQNHGSIAHAVERGLDDAPEEAGRLAHALYELKDRLATPRLLDLLASARDALPDGPQRVELTLDHAALRRTRGLGVTAEELWGLVNDAAGHPPLLGRAQRIFAGLLRDQGDNAQARALYEKALASARTEGDLLEEANHLDAIGLLLSSQGEFGAAAGQHVEALARYRQAAAPPGQIRSLGNLGKCLRAQGRHDQARDAFKQALALAREHHETRMVAKLLTNLANLATLEHRNDEARPLLMDAVEIQRRLGAQKGAAMTLCSLAALELLSVRPLEAEAHALQALHQLEGTGDLRAIGWAHSLAGLASLQSERIPSAIERLTEASSMLRTAGATHIEPAVQAVLAAAHVLDGDKERGLELLGSLDIPAAHAAHALMTDAPFATFTQRAASEEELAVWRRDSTVRMLEPLLKRQSY